MYMSKVFRCVLAVALVSSAGLVVAQEAKTPPSVDSIIDSLRVNESEQEQIQTRALRPGAASMATTAPTPAPAPVARPAKPASINMQVNFDFNSDRISGSSQTTVANLAAALASPQLEGRNFTIVGHTDGKGAAAYNQALSERRAASVRRYLINNGVDASRLRAVGKGKSELLNADDPFAAENRRVQILATGG